MNLNGKKWKGRKRMIAIKEKNVITIEFEGHDTLESPMLYQYDTGQKIKFVDVPDGVEVQFSNENSETTDNRILADSQVEIPDFLISEGLEITAYIQYINDQSETTIKVLTIPIECRTKQQDIVPDEDKGAFRRQIEQIMNDTKKAAEEAADKVESNKEFLEQTQQKANEASESAMRAENSESNINATVNAFNDMSETKKIELINVADAKMTDINSVIVPHMYSDEGEPLSDPENYKDIKVGDLYLSRTNNSVWYCYSVAEEEGIKTSCYWLKIQQNLGVGTNIEINSNVISVKDKPTFKGLYSVDERMEVTGGLTVGGSEETILGGEGNITVAGAGSVTFAKEDGTTFSKPVVTADELTANGVSTFNGWATYNLGLTINGYTYFHQPLQLGEIRLTEGTKSISSDRYPKECDNTNTIILGASNDILLANRSMILGNDNNFDNCSSKSLVVGDKNIFKGRSQGLIFGNYNRLYIPSVIAIGDNNIVSGTFGKSFGVANQVTGSHSTAIGSNNLAGGDYSLMIGSSCQGTSNYAVAIGEDNQAYENQFVIGKHNQIVTNGELFVVGNGASDTERSNALWLTKDGDLHIAGQLYSAGLEDEYTMIKQATEPAVEDTMLGKYLDIPTNKYNEIIFVISGELKGDGYSDKIGLAKNKTSFEETIPAGNTTVNTIFRVKKLTDSKCLMELNGYNTQITKAIERDGSLIISGDFKEGTRYEVYVR